MNLQEFMTLPINKQSKLYFDLEYDINEMAKAQNNVMAKADKLNSI